MNSDPDVYVKAAVTSDDPDLQASLDACNNFTKASITYTFGDETVTLDGSTIKDWLNFDEKGQLIRDDASFQQHIADYVAQLAAAHDTSRYGTFLPDNQRKNCKCLRFCLWLAD